MFPEEVIQEGDDEVTPAETMGLKLNELREGNEHGKRGLSRKNLGATLISATLIKNSKYMRM